MRRLALSAFVLFLLLAGGASAEEGVRVELAPDLILVNAKVLTFDKDERVVEAVAMKRDRILALGANDSIRALAGSRTEIIDAGGRLVLPGFVDAHSHTTGVPPAILIPAFTSSAIISR